MPIRSSHDSRGMVLAVICFFLFPQMMLAEVSLPLNGYCKPGRFFPIKVDGEDAARSITFSADECVPTQINGSQHGAMIIPMLATGAPRLLTWPGGSAPLLTPKDDERLIASTSDQVSEASQIFPGNRLIPVKLDAADLLAGPPAAWESLDAILLNTELFARITDAQRSTLLAGGVTLAAIGETAPDARWPWRREGSLWILRCPIAGPAQIVDENAYIPTFNWQPGWSATVRGQLMGAATLMVLIIIALLIGQSRFTRWIAIALPLMISAGVAGWRGSMDPIDRAGGDIIVNHIGLTQRDQWVYEKAKQSCTSTVPWSELTHPIFSSESAESRSAIQLIVLATGETEFLYQAMPQHTMAFARRDVLPVEMQATNPTHQSPMQDLVKEEYLISGNRIVGETEAIKGRWTGVVVECLSLSH